MRCNMNTKLSNDDCHLQEASCCPLAMHCRLLYQASVKQLFQHQGRMALPQLHRPSKAVVAQDSMATNVLEAMAAMVVMSQASDVHAIAKLLNNTRHVQAPA